MEIRLMKAFGHINKTVASAFTLVELMIVTVISLLLGGVIVSFIVGVTDQFAVSAVRGQMNAQVTSATNRLENDIRYARSILAENSVTDGAAPSNDNRWNSGPDQLVLGATARDSANEPLSDDYTSQLDNIVYYLKDGTLYRRLLAFSDANNRYTTATCASTATGGCSTDTVILRNVSSFNLTYYNDSGAATTAYDEAKSVKVDINLATTQARHQINLKGGSTFRLTSFTKPSGIPGIPSFQGSINAGYGGVQVGYSSSFNIDGDISTLGNFTVANSSNVKVNNIYAAHLNCGPTYSMQYGSLCPPTPAAISIGSGGSSSTKLTANSACAPATPVATNSSWAGALAIATLTTSCSLPDALPSFDKQALVGDIPAENTTTGNITCFSIPSGSVANLSANHRYLGDVDLAGGCSGKISGSGVVYIKGDFKLGSNSVLSFDPSVTEPVTIVVNGRVTIYNAKVGNSSTPKPNIISFYSTNSTCSNSDSCNSLSMQDLYDSARSVNHNVLIHHSLTEVYANIYAPFSTITFTNSPKVEVGEVYGQVVDISHGNLGSFALSP